MYKESSAPYFFMKRKIPLQLLKANETLIKSVCKENFKIVQCVPYNRLASQFFNSTPSYNTLYIVYDSSRTDLIMRHANAKSYSLFLKHNDNRVTEKIGQKLKGATRTEIIHNHKIGHKVDQNEGKRYSLVTKRIQKELDTLEIGGLKSMRNLLSQPDTQKSTNNNF